MSGLWSTENEIDFFIKALESFSSPSNLFYKIENENYAFVPKKSKATGDVLNSRNSLIGNYTEKWCQTTLEPIAKKFKLFAVTGVVCEELGLTKQSSADLAFCTTDAVQQSAENIKLIFEVKMSIVSNYLFTPPNNIVLCSDFKQHKGQPSILRSDSVLKAIGKSINIRVSSASSSTIPILVLGNSPVSQTYLKKIDLLTTGGVLQGFVSLNPNPSKTNFIVESPKKGFQTVKNFDELENICENLLNEEYNYFSAMLSKSRLVEIIKISSNEVNDVAIAETFLKLLREQ